MSDYIKFWLARHVAEAVMAIAVVATLIAVFILVVLILYAYGYLRRAVRRRRSMGLL